MEKLTKKEVTAIMKLVKRKSDFASKLLKSIKNFRKNNLISNNDMVGMLESLKHELLNEFKKDNKGFIV